MDVLPLNNEATSNAFLNQDVLSVFKQNTKRAMTIHQGMSPTEISDVVSEKVITVVKEQFEVTKTEFQQKGTNRNSSKFVWAVPRICMNCSENHPKQHWR